MQLVSRVGGGRIGHWPGIWEPLVPCEVGVCGPQPDGSSEIGEEQKIFASK